MPLLATLCLRAATVPLNEADEVAVMNAAETLELAGALAGADAAGDAGLAELPAELVPEEPQAAAPREIRAMPAARPAARGRAVLVLARAIRLEMVTRNPSVKSLGQAGNGCPATRCRAGDTGQSARPGRGAETTQRN